jgi:hypothetical protein
MIRACRKDCIYIGVLCTENAFAAKIPWHQFWNHTSIESCVSRSVCQCKALLFGIVRYSKVEWISGSYFTLHTDHCNWPCGPTLVLLDCPTLQHHSFCARHPQCLCFLDASEVWCLCGCQLSKWIQRMWFCRCFFQACGFGSDILGSTTMVYRAKDTRIGTCSEKNSVYFINSSRGEVVASAVNIHSSC